MISEASSKPIWRIWLLSCLVLAANIHVAAADTATIFKQLAGSWHGLGNLTLSDGHRERISCRGYYVPKETRGLSLAILCNSPNYKVEIRSRLTGRGRNISGTWEERTFHAMGDVKGRATGNRLSLSIGGAIRGNISISLGGGRRQAITISTQGTGFRKVTISLVRG